MINEKVKAFLDEKSLGDRLTEHTETIDTVEHAAQQIGCSEPRKDGNRLRRCKKINACELCFLKYSSYFII